MKDIAIYGAGGFGREVACLIRRINAVEPEWNMVGFSDDGKQKGETTEYGVVLGGMDTLNVWSEPLCVAIAIGSPKAVATIVEKINNPMVQFPNIIAPDTILLDEMNYTLGQGNILCTGCVLSCHVRIGDFNTFNGFVSVGHDAVIGNYNSMMPAVRISGEVHMGDRNFFGAGSIVLQQISIGNDIVVGAGSFLIRKPKDGNTYVGNPATIVKL